MIYYLHWRDVNLYYMNRIKQHLFNWFEYFKEHFIRIVFIIAFFGICCFLFTLLPRENVLDSNYNIAEQHIVIFGITLENWLTALSIIGLIIGAIWAIYQFDKNVNRKQQEKASEIAKDFANNFVERFSIISEVLLKNEEIRTMLSKITNENLKSFTNIEILDMVNDKNCFNKYSQIINSKKTQIRYEKLLNKLYNKKEKEKFNSYFPLLVENTLNQLEAACINISSNAAGSEYIYNSLHQSFLKFVEILSIRISTNNRNNVDKYYTHIIQVYNMWNNQKYKDIEKFKKTQKKINKLNSKAKKEIKKLLEKKNKTV